MRLLIIMLMIVTISFGITDKLKMNKSVTTTLVVIQPSLKMFTSSFLNKVKSTDYQYLINVDTLDKCYRIESLVPI